MTSAPTPPKLRPVAHAIYFEMTVSPTERFEVLVISGTPSVPNGFGTLVHRNVSATSKGQWNVSTYSANAMDTMADPARGGKMKFNMAPADMDPIVKQLSTVSQVLASMGGTVARAENNSNPLLALMQVSVQEYLELGWGSDPGAGAKSPYKLLSRAQDIYDGVKNNVVGAFLEYEHTELDDKLIDWFIDSAKYTYKYDGRALINDRLGYMMAGTFSQEVFDTLDEQVPPIGRLGLVTDGQLPGKKRDEPSLMNQYPRPNGEIYYSRSWTGIEDVQVLKTARKHSQFPLLYGPPGTGKTALSEAAFGADLITIMITGDTEVSDLVGQFIPNPKHGEPGEGEYIWIDGPLVHAVAEGRPCLIDEIGLGDPKMLSVLYPLMDGRGELQVTMNPDRGVITAADGFFILGATNPNAPGVQMSEALLSRFNLHVEVQTDWALAIQQLEVPEKIAGLAQGLNKRVMAGEISWAPQMRELLTFKKLKAVYGEGFALANLMASCPEEDRAVVQSLVTRVFGAAALPARIGPA